VSPTNDDNNNHKKIFLSVKSSYIRIELHSHSTHLTYRTSRFYRKISVCIVEVFEGKNINEIGLLHVKKQVLLSLKNKSFLIEKQSPFSIYIIIITVPKNLRF